MCTASLVASTMTTLISTGASVYQDYNEIKTSKENLKYKVQIAQNNAKKAQELGNLSKQTGIEEARKEKIKGIEEQKKKLAYASAGGFDALSGSNLLNSDYALTSAQSSAVETQKYYDRKAKEYFENANNYINNSNYAIQSFNNSLKMKNAQYLGELGKVAKNWYREDSDGDFNI